MLSIYFAGHTIKFSDVNNVFSTHDRKWASVFYFVECCGINLGATS